MKELECNGLCTIVSQALEKRKAEQGENFSLSSVDLAMFISMGVPKRNFQQISPFQKSNITQVDLSYNFCSIEYYNIIYGLGTIPQVISLPE